MDLMDGADWMRAPFRAALVGMGRPEPFRPAASADDWPKTATRLISREVVVHAERGVIVDQFYAERLYAK